MELDQIVKRLGWLDEEHRKDKHALNALEERLASLDGNLKSLVQQVKEMSGEISRLTTVAADRMMLESGPCVCWFQSILGRIQSGL